MEVKAFCEECQRPRTIVPTGRRRHPEQGTDQWGQFVSHKTETGEFCRLSGSLV